MGRNKVPGAKRSIRGLDRFKTQRISHSEMRDLLDALGVERLSDLPRAQQQLLIRATQR